MSNHVTEWLNPYLDGELHGHRLHLVEDHLTGCEACQAELDSLRDVSVLLQEVPTPVFTPNERFVAQVNLPLPQTQGKPARSKVIEFTWWMIPVGLLTAWIFISTAVLVSDMVSTANRLGLLDSTSTLLIADASGNELWASMLGLIGLLEGDSLKWIELTEEFTRNVLPQFIWQVSIAFLYLTWIAIGWARRMRREQVPFLEG